MDGYSYKFQALNISCLNCKFCAPALSEAMKPQCLKEDIQKLAERSHGLSGESCKNRKLQITFVQIMTEV